MFAGPSSVSGSKPVVAEPSGAVTVRAVPPGPPDGAPDAPALGAPLPGTDPDGEADGTDPDGAADGSPDPAADGTGVTDGAGA